MRTSTHARYKSEIIVVDDASSDASWQVIEKLEREGLIQHKSKFSENRGPAAARTVEVAEGLSDHYCKPCRMPRGGLGDRIKRLDRRFAAGEGASEHHSLAAVARRVQNQ